MRFGLAVSALAVSVWLSGCATSVDPAQPANAADPASAPTAPGAAAVAEPPLLAGALRPDHPHSYTVQPDDSVYGISAMFLNEPWRWRGLWDRQDAPRLFPGSVLQLSASAPPRLEVAAVGGTIKLSPQVRIDSAVAAIPTIPREIVAPFLNNAVVMTEKQWRDAPYVIGNASDRLRPADGALIYARGDDLYADSYRIFRPGRQLVEPDSGESLGYIMIYVGEAAVESDPDADPVELRLVETERGVRPGDRLFEIEQEVADASFTPIPAPADTSGRIIAALDEALAVSRFSNVAVNLGAFDGMEPGSVLAVYDQGGSVVDPLTGERLALPEVRTGVIVLYKVFDLVSYGLVTEAERAIRINDRVGTP